MSHHHQRRRHGQGRGRGHRAGTSWRRPKHNVPVNIIEHDDHFEAMVFAVGFAKEEIRITISNDVLYISGQREPADEYPNFLLQEYPIKSFERWFELSDKADQRAITAQQVDGILHIKVPKVAQAVHPDHEVEIG
jgi:HSP20 family protein